MVLAFTLAGFSTQVLQSSPVVGDASGTASYLASAQAKMLQEHPEFLMDLVSVKGEFEYSHFAEAITEAQVQEVLHFTDACTDVHASDIMKNAEQRKEAAWLWFLDAKARARAAPAYQQELLSPRK
jgi:hypothetical protein